MKKIALISLFLTPAAFAQDAPLVVAPAAGDLQISIPFAPGQPSLVRDRRVVSLPTGRSTLRFSDAPSALDKASLQLGIDRSVAVLSQKSGVLSDNSFDLTSFVGKQIALLRPLGSAGEKGVTGKLLRASSPVLLETGEGILLDPPGVWLLPREPNSNLGAGAANGFQWLLEAARGGEWTADALYATPHLGWNAGYIATLSPARDRLSLRATLNFQNGSGASFRDAKVSLRDEDGTAFAPPRAVTLGAGETPQILAATDVAVQETLIFDAENGRRFDAVIQNAHPQRSMTLENSAPNGLGIYLPVGTLALWQGDGAATLRLDKIAKWGGFWPDALISVPLGTENSVSISRFIASSKLLNPITREIVVAWLVTTESGSPRVTIIDNLPPRFKLTGATLKPVAASDNELRFETQISSDKPVEFRYTVEVPA